MWRPVWLKRSEQGGNREGMPGRKLSGAVLQGLVGLKENLDFYPGGDENPGWLWAKGQDLTQVHTGTLYWLLSELPGEGQGQDLIQVLTLVLWRMPWGGQLWG